MFTLKQDQIEKFTKCKENNTDPYGSRIVNYAIDWAYGMEKRMQAGESLSKKLMDEEGTKADYDGTTGFMYGSAVNIIANSWIHGEEFRQIYNGQFGHTGKGVVNPAIVTIAV